MTPTDQLSADATEFLLRLKSKPTAADDLLMRLLARVHELEAERARLRAALEWYGEQARLCRLIHGEGDAGRHALGIDGGNRARVALVGPIPTVEK